MAYTSGGRGKKAPYQTTHVRVPVPIKDQVEQLINDYKTGTLDQLTIDDALAPISFDDAVEQARVILKQKKSATTSMTKLLTSIYHQQVSL